MAVEEGVNADQYTQDGTVDLKGNPVLRSKRGGWTACFLCCWCLSECILWHIVQFDHIFDDQLHQGTVSSANNVTNWLGTIWITPILGAYVADAHLGRYWTFLTACIIYLSGMCVLTLAVSLPALRPPKCLDANVENCKKASTLQLAVFYGALYTLAIGTGGTKPNISTIGADQFDDFEPKEKAQKLSFFNWWMFSIFFGTLFAYTILVYIQDNVGWSLGYGLPTLGLLISILVFLAGTPFYRHKVPTGSPFTRMAKVIVAAIRKRKVTLPSDPKELYELQLEEYATKGKYRIDSTPSVRFLNKAAVKTASTSPWRLCSVNSSRGDQANAENDSNLDCHILYQALWFHRSIPFLSNKAPPWIEDLEASKSRPASLGAFVTISMLISVVLYDRFFVKFMRKLTKNPRGITLLQRMGIGMGFSTF
ncbi:hypothetical protein M0R45_018522 [Rubus argutus]|uniref:Uncharacterized protein n=1 Tax=Rubus argutus TaxID=59490 RepID=A0AAW1X4G8_RUBAR